MESLKFLIPWYVSYFELNVFSAVKLKNNSDIRLSRLEMVARSIKNYGIIMSADSGLPQD